MKIEKFNDVLALVFLVFILLWAVLMFAAIKWLGITVIEALGLGTIFGVLLAILKDVFQFYFRTNKPDSKNGGTG